MERCRVIMVMRQRVGERERACRNGESGKNLKRERTQVAASEAAAKA
jgi:hypothetical protein